MTRCKRFFLIGLCLLLTLLATLPVSPALAYNSFYSRAAIKNLRVRRDPDQNLAAIDHLKLDQLVWVIEEAYDGKTRMYQIEYIDASGTRTTGWVPCTTGETHYMRDLSDEEVAKLNYATKGTLPTDVTSDSSSSGSSSSGSSSSGSASSYKGKYVKLGTKSSLVKDVQTALKKKKMYAGDITGTCGTRTVAAIKAFQKKEGLAADGVAGPATLAALLGGSSGSGGDSSSSGSSGSGSSGGSSGDYGYTKVNKVNFRSGPSTSDASKALLTTNTVFIVSETKSVGNYTWYYVELVDGGSKGYIRGDMLSIMTAAQLAEYKAGKGITDGSSSSGSSSGATGLTSGMARITASNVNVRSGPSTSDKSNGKAARGDVFNITNSEAVSGATWYKLSGKTSSLAGWVHGDYIHIMTDEEMDEYSKANPGSSSSGGGSGSYRLLKYGSKGNDVSKLQQALKDKSFFTGTVTGNYGKNTESAVRAYQKKNGLYVDGIAGTNTQAMLYGDTANATNVPMPTITSIVNIEWTAFKNSNIWPNGGAGVVTDVRTRKSFNIKKQSAGNHLDVEPATANDTAIMKQIYGGSITYQRRPVWLTIGVGNKTATGFETYAGSMYGVAHGADTVPGNNFDGQFCIHLLHSTNHVAGKEDSDHQAAVAEAAKATP